MPRLVAPIPPDRRVRRFAQLGTGLVLYGATASMLVLADLGLDPWDVFHQGMSRTFGLGIGTWAIIASVLVLVCGWVPLQQRPRIGTITNAIVVGLVMDVILAAVHPPRAWARTRRSSAASSARLPPALHGVGLAPAP
jgi:uncharacterized membrane protein YczE